MAVIPASFEGSRIENGSFRYIREEGNAAQLELGCVGYIEGSTETQTKEKLCGGVPLKRISSPKSHTVTIRGQIRADFIQKIYGMTNEGLKPGVFAYGPDAKPEPFMLTVNVIDEFEGTIKLLAFPDLSVVNGMAYTYDPSTDSFEGVEIELSANVDANGKWFYEADKDTVDPAIATAWHTNLTPEMLKLVV